MRSKSPSEVYLFKWEVVTDPCSHRTQGAEAGGWQAKGCVDYIMGSPLI